MIYQAAIMICALTVSNIIGVNQLKATEVRVPEPVHKVAVTKSPIKTPQLAPTTPIVEEYKAPPAPAAQPAPVSAPASATGTNSAMQFIFLHESSNRPAVVNSIGACGLGQALPCSKLANVCPNWQTDVPCQISFFTDYANSRYGGWDNAKAFWLVHSWW